MKSKLAVFSGPHILSLSLVQPWGFSQKAKADHWPKAAVVTADQKKIIGREQGTTQLGKQHGHHCCQREKETVILLNLKPPSPQSQSPLVSVLEIHKRIKSVELALLKPPQAAALILLACTSYCGPGLLLACVESNVRCRVGLSAGLSDGLVKLHSGCVNRGLGQAGAIEVIPVCFKMLYQRQGNLLRPSRVVIMNLSLMENIQ